MTKLTKQKRNMTITVAAGAALLLGGVTDVRAESPRQDQTKQAQGQTDLDPSILFDSDSSHLTEEAKTELQRLAVWAQADSENLIYLAGRSGDQNAQSDSELGLQREEAARDFLESQGVAPVQIRSMAEAQRPMAADADGSTAETRRIVFLMSTSDGVADVATTAPASEVEPPATVVHNNTFVQPAEPVVIEPAPMISPTFVEEDKDADDHLLTRDGMAFRVGGGVMNFIDDGTRDVTNTGGSWEARLTYGTRSLLGAEVAYVGSVQGINALGLDSSANLLGSGGEAALRINVPGMRYVQPYAVAGLGMTNYRVVNANFNDSNIADSENVLHVPLGAGIGFRTSGILLDLRGTYRRTFEDAQLAASTDDVDVESTDSGFDSWMATASAGIEF